MHIDIHHLHLRLKGVPPHVARAAIAGLGPALLRRLAEQPPHAAALHRQCDRLDAGTVPVADATPPRVRRAVTDAVARTLAGPPSRPNR